MSRETMSNARTHVNDSILEIDTTSWLIGERLLLSQQESQPSFSGLASWSDGCGGFFVLLRPEASSPYANTRPLEKDYPHLTRVYETGEAFIKIHEVGWPRVTREHVTLEFVKSKKPLPFTIPEVLFHDEFDQRYYLILSKVPGDTLARAWPAMESSSRQTCVRQVAEICALMAEWKGDGAYGVHGKEMLELYLGRQDNAVDESEKLRPSSLLSNCERIGMDITSLSFHHCDLGPGNVLVDLNTDPLSIGIIDWGVTGYVPREWIRTKFRLSGGMDFEFGDNNEQIEWRRSVAQQLEAMGFTDVVHEWIQFAEGEQ